MDIRNIIVHEVRKEEEHAQADIELREEENPVDEHAQRLVTQLSELFRKTGLSTGGFTAPEHNDDPRPHFVGLLENYFDGHSFSNFVAFAKAAARDLKRKIDGSGSSKGGYLWFNHYVYNDENFLSVVLLRKKNGLSLSRDLSLAEVEELDLDKLHMAARINLSAWLEGSSAKYVAFRVGRSAKEVTDYFSSFIGCEEYTRARIDTQNLVQVTKRYCVSNGFSDERAEEVKQFVYEQCCGWLDSGNLVLLENISSIVDSRFQPEEQGVFLQIAQDDPFLLNNEILVERSALRGLTRYAGKTRKMSISFDSDLLNVSVFYNKEAGEVRFTDLPPSLERQLLVEAPE